MYYRKEVINMLPYSLIALVVAGLIGLIFNENGFVHLFVVISIVTILVMAISSPTKTKTNQK